jgi:hypothetical protein
VSVRRKVRILAPDGIGHTAKVINDTTGDEIPGVTGVTWSLDVGDYVAHADIRVLMPKVDVLADAAITEVCPYCGHEKEQT